MLLEDVDDAHGEEVAQRIARRLLVRRRALAGQRAVGSRASIGIASARAGHGVDADELMRHADVAMYRAKEAGKGQVRVWTPEMQPTP